MDINSHPAHEHLRDFILGKLPTELADELSQHLEVCPNCEKTVAALESESNTLLSLLEAPAAIPEFVSESGYLRAAEFVRGIGRDTTTTWTPASDAPDLQRLREYELLEKLGEGGMGAVYKARHARLNKIVAVKVLSRDRMASTSAVARFEREMLAAGSLDDRHLVRAHDAGEVDGTHFLVMEYVAGADLAAIVREHGPLAIADACELIRQAALGLQYVHEHGFVHRDIKPSNLMLSRDGQVKVLDLGLALLQGPELTNSGRELTGAGQIMGTVDYMAPEQVGDSHRVDIRADIFSLGATLYKLLAGVAPFAALADDSLINRFVALATAPHAPLAQHRPEAPPALGELLDRMLAKQPASRPSTPAEVAAALAPFAQTHLLTALLSSAPHRQKSGKPDTHSYLSSPDTGTAHDLPLRATTSTGVCHPVEVAGQPPRARRRVVLLAGAGGSVLAMFAVWVIFLNGLGDEVGRIKAPDNVTRIAILPDAPPSAAGAAADRAAPPLAVAPFSATQARQHQDAWAHYLGTRVDIANTLDMRFRLIPPGRFQMGSAQGDPNEQPVHQVTISKPYFLGIYEVIQREYEEVIGDNPSKFNGARLPVEFVTSDDAVKFCQRLSERDGHVYRLPTEAEWEFACRAGTTTEWNFGDDPVAGVDYFWCKENGDEKTHPVGEKLPNPFGLFDMHGNVFEYCADFTRSYTADPVIDPRGPSFGRYRGFRGGSWYFPRFDSRSADRQDKQWPARGTHVGFRVVREVALPDRMPSTTVEPN